MDLNPFHGKKKYRDMDVATSSGVGQVSLKLVSLSPKLVKLLCQVGPTVVQLKVGNSAFFLQ